MIQIDKQGHKHIWQFIPFLLLFSVEKISMPPLRNMHHKNKTKQECIPVGSLPPAHWPHLVVSGGEGTCDWGVCVPGGMHTQEACMTWQGMLGYTCPVDRIPDTHLWKHYLPATTAAGGKNWTQRTSLPLFLNLTDVISVLPFIKPLLFWVQYVPKIDIVTVKCD